MRLAVLQPISLFRGECSVSICLGSTNETTLCEASYSNGELIGDRRVGKHTIQWLRMTGKVNHNNRVSVPRKGPKKI